jgi:nucleotide-binding universal stress UspA family protein
MTTEEHPTDGGSGDPEAGGARRRVVVGVDGSGTSQVALRTAFLEAARRGADLDVVAAYPEALIWTGGAPVAVPDQRGVQTDTATRLRSVVEEVGNELLVEDMAGLGDVGVRRIVDCGPPAPVLEGHAEGAELLVVGSRGRGALASALLGSVALHCVTHAPCPVLVVHGNAEVRLPASAAVVIGFDGSDAALDALREAVAEAGRLGCRVEVLAAYAQEYYWTDVYTAAPPATEHVRTTVREQAEQAIRTVTAELTRSGATVPPMSVVIVEGTAAGALVERSADAAMLVVGSRGRGPIRGLVLGSVALHCAIHARCPVLVVHPRHGIVRGEEPAGDPMTAAGT